MSAQLLDGKKLSEAIRYEIRQRVSALPGQLRPGLAVVLVGEDPASQIYVRNKTKACAEVGIESFQHSLPVTTTRPQLEQLLNELNADPKVHGILVQLPLPPQLKDFDVTLAIRPEKDVDGFHPINLGNLLTGRPAFRSCTPYGIMKLLDSIRYPLAGKHAVVVGRSNIVGKPVALMLLEQNATVTLCHSKTQDLAEHVRRADVLIAAVGVAELISGAWIKEGAVVVDVGMNRRADGKLCGDVEFATAAQRASYITPVPGGVGPMTITMLLWNTLQAAQSRFSS